MNTRASKTNAPAPDHLRCHGSVPTNKPTGPTQLVLPPDLEIFTRLDGRRDSVASVIMSSTRGPFHLNFSLSSKGARELAEMLTSAADVADAETRKTGALNPVEKPL